VKCICFISFKVFQSLIVLCKEFSSLPSREDATALKIQAPEINPLADSKSMIGKGATVNEDRIKGDELTKYASHFEYISTMTSFDDSFFKSTIRKDLLKDRHVSWKAFKSLSPQLVRRLARFQFNTNLLGSNMHLQLIGTSSCRLFLLIIHPRPKPSGI
jgi:hypothetical protein